MRQALAGSVVPVALAVLALASCGGGSGGGGDPSPGGTGHTYYVDAVGGDDGSGDGTAGAPFRTIPRVWSLLTGGDTVVLASGDYARIAAGFTGDDAGDAPYIREPADVFRDWVTFKAGAGQTPHVASLDLGCWNLHANQSLPFDHVGNADGYLRFEGITFDDGVSILGLRHVVVKGGVIHRQGALNGSVANIDGKPGVQVFNGQDVTIEGNEITHVAIGLEVMSTDLVVRGNDIHGNSHDGIRLYGGSDILFENNQIHDLDDGVDDCFLADGVTKCGTSDPTWDPEAGQAWDRHADGIQIFVPSDTTKWAKSFDHVTFRGNVFYHLEAAGLIFMVENEFPCIAWVFENNILGPTGGNMLHWGGKIDGFTFRHNTIVHLPATTWTSLYRTLDGPYYRISYWPDGEGKQVYDNLFYDGRQMPHPTAQGLVKGSAEADEDWYGYFAVFAGNVYMYAPSAPWNVLLRDEKVLARLPYADGDLTGALLTGGGAVDAGTRLGEDGRALTDPLDVDILGHPRDNRPDAGAYEVQGRHPAKE